MPKVVDLSRVRRALADLAKLAEDHPEAFHSDRLRLLTDNLEEILMTPSRDRMAAYRTRVKAEGRKRITVTLSPDATKALEALQATGRYPDLNTAVSTALVGFAKFPAERE